ncbi:hypothetical protein AB3R30_26475 [Leptolyngbyaceae cyanobacterium UHCC 1019]
MTQGIKRKSFKVKIPVSVLQINLFSGILDLFDLKIVGARNVAQQYWCMGCKSDLNTALIWVIKDQAKITDREKYKDFFELLKTPDVKASKPQGMFLGATLELCYGVLSLAESLEVSDSIPYKTADQWWQYCVLEYADGTLNNVGHRRTKREIEAGIREMVRELKAKINPFDSETDPHQFNLIEAAMRMGSHLSSDNNDAKAEKRFFREKYWKSYLSAVQGLKSGIRADSSLKAVYINDFGGFVAIMEGKREVRIFEGVTV